MFNRFLLRGAAIVVAILVAIEIVPRLGLGLAAESLITLAIGLAGLWAILRALGGVGDRKLEEIAQGYTTLEIQFGGFWFGEGRRWPQFGHRAPWDYSGLWLLTPSGEVVSAPDPAIEPPGLYPSPNRPGALELWSGVVWTGIYRGAH